MGSASNRDSYGRGFRHGHAKWPRDDTRDHSIAVRLWKVGLMILCKAPFNLYHARDMPHNRKGAAEALLQSNNPAIRQRAADNYIAVSDIVFTLREPHRDRFTAVHLSAEHADLVNVLNKTTHTLDHASHMLSCSG
jgi:hypothetical protein